MKFTNNPIRFFLITALLFGLIYLFLIPPFQFPDEGHHYYRAYHISDGNFFGEKTLDSRFGGMIPKSMVKFENDFRFLRYNYNQKSNYKSIIDHNQSPLEKNKRIFADFPNVAYYAPFPYFPQSIGIGFGKMINAPPLTLLYLSRMVAFLCWLLIVWWGLRIVPFHKWTFVAVALLPASLFLLKISFWKK